MLPSIVCKMMIINMFYLFYFILSINFLFGVNYLHSEKSIENLKNKSEILIQNENFELTKADSLAYNDSTSAVDFETYLANLKIKFKALFTDALWIEILFLF